MKPKEKAKELVDRYMIPIDELNKYPMCFDTAKQCALICVDEILNNYEDCYYQHSTQPSEILIYWQEVKQELNNL